MVNTVLTTILLNGDPSSLRVPSTVDPCGVTLEKHASFALCGMSPDRPSIGQLPDTLESALRLYKIKSDPTIPVNGGRLGRVVWLA